MKRWTFPLTIRIEGIGGIGGKNKNIELYYIQICERLFSFICIQRVVHLFFVFEIASLIKIDAIV
jgi:hypothetical protein